MNQSIVPEETLTNSKAGLPYASKLTLDWSNVPKTSSTPSQSSATVPVAEISQPQTPTPDFTERLPQSKVADSLASIKEQALAIQDTINSRAEAENAPLSPRDQAFENFIDVSQEDLSPAKTAIRDASGIYEKEEHSRNIFNRMRERDVFYRDRIERLEENPEGKLKGALNAEINDIERERSRELADLSFAYQVALGDYQAAEKIVSDRIADLEADRQNRINLWQQAVTFAQNDMTESEKLQAQQNFDREMKAIDFEASKELALFNDKLARQRQAIADARADSRGVKRSTQIVDVDGTKMLIDTQSGEVIREFGFNEDVNEFALAKDKSNIEAFSSLINHEGINKAVGPTKLARWTPFTIDVMDGNVTDFIGEVDSLTKDLTLDNLIQRKSEGATFGALNKEEFSTIADSATKINSWRRTSGNGDNTVTTHFAASEKDFRDEVQVLTNFAKLDYVLKGGDPSSVGIIIQPDGSYWSQNYDGSMTKIR